MIGVILLIGFVNKNGIMLVDLTAILGGIPLMIGHGAGAEIRQPLGYAIVGGLVVSQLLTLFTTPVIYLALDSLRRGQRAKPKNHTAGQSPAGIALPS